MVMFGCSQLLHGNVWLQSVHGNVWLQSIIAG